MLVITSWVHEHQLSKKLTAQIFEQAVMEELVRHTHYNSAPLADSYARMARVREFRNWLKVPLYSSLEQWMIEMAQMIVLVVDRA